MLSVQWSTDRHVYCFRTICVQGEESMIRVCRDRLYLFSGYLAGLFLIAIFVLMMLLSAGRRVAAVRAFACGLPV